MATTALFSETDLTSDSFHSVLDRLTEEYAVRPLSGHSEPGDLLLRHDVALSVADAVTMAKAEAERGVQGTYCIMLGSPLFNPLDRTQQSRIRDIQSYGHDIGLLVNPHDHWETEPSVDEIAELVSKQQDVLDRIVPESSLIVAFHRPPGWVQQRTFSEFRNALAPKYTGGLPCITDDARAGENSQAESVESAQLVLHPALWMSAESDYDRKVERSVIESCRYVNRRARAEFVDPVRR